MTEADSKIVNPETPKTCVWLNTSDGAIQEVEREVAMCSPFLWNEILSGMGSSENCPISLPSKVNAPVLSLILDYCRFHQVPGRSNKEKKLFNEKFFSIDAKSLCELAGAADRLQLSNLVSLTSRTIAREINGRNAVEIRELLHLPDDLTEEEKLAPIRDTMGIQRLRLWNRLQAKKREDLKGRERVKYDQVDTEAIGLQCVLQSVEVEERVDDRSVDELLSFINGGDGDFKGTGMSKNKKKNGRRKDHQKTSSNCICTANSSSSLRNATDIHKESSEIDLAGNNAIFHGNCQSGLGNSTNLLDAPEDGFDDCDLDPAMKEIIDREVEDFARILDSDWPEMQEILSMGQERRPLSFCINRNGSLRRYTRLGQHQN